MAPSVEEVANNKPDLIEIDPKNLVTQNASTEELKSEHAPIEPKETEQQVARDVADDKEKLATASETEPKNKEIDDKNDMKKEENVPVQVEPKTGVSFPVRLDDGKALNAVGMRKKSILGIGIKIYAFGMFADNDKLKELMKLKIEKAPAKPSKEMYQAVIDSDSGMMVRLVIVFANLTMNMVKKNFDEGLGASIKKLNGGRKNDELSNKVMGEASDDIKLTAGSVIEITRLPGYILQTKVKDEVVSKVESELLCRAFIYMYLGEDPFDKDAKERFGMSLLSLF